MTAGSASAPALVESWLEVSDGNAPVLLIAPHGGRAGDFARATLHPKVNDLQTAAITRELARRLNASALINAGMDRNELDCNRLAQLGARAPWMLDLILSRIERIVAQHGRAIVLLIHGWNIIEPRVDLGLGLRQVGSALRPPAGAHVSASDAFINGAVKHLADRLRSAAIEPTFGLRYPGGAAQNLLQAFTTRHRRSDVKSLGKLAEIAQAGVIDALQLEMSVTVRFPGELRERNLDALTQVFSRPAMPPPAIERAVSIIRSQSPPRAKQSVPAQTTAPPSRVGVEFYDAAAGLGGMISFDFGPGAAGGRIMLLFNRSRVALFTAEGKCRRSAEGISLGPLAIVSDAVGARVNFRGPAIVVDDGAAYLSVERALAEGRLDARTELEVSVEFASGAPNFDVLFANLDGTPGNAQQGRLLPISQPSRFGESRATFGRLRGTVVLDGTRRSLDAVARIGASFTGLGSSRFVTRRMLWAWIQSNEISAIEARCLTYDDAPGHSVARVLKSNQWTDAGAKIALDSLSASLAPEHVTASIEIPCGESLSIVGRPATFMTLSRPGPEGTRIHTTLGFATYMMNGCEGAGMYEYSRRAESSAGPNDSDDT